MNEYRVTFYDEDGISQWGNFTVLAANEDGAVVVGKRILPQGLAWPHQWPERAVDVVVELTGQRSKKK